MSASPQPAWASTRRETYRRRNGWFGTQPHTDPGIVDEPSTPALPTGFDVVREAVMGMTSDVTAYEASDLEDRTNYYGAPIVKADRFRQLHQVVDTPADPNLPPVCACGWTREQADGEQVEIQDHVGSMGPYGAGAPWTAAAREKWEPPALESLELGPLSYILARSYESMSHERRWRVAAFVNALPLLTGEQFKRAIRPTMVAARNGSTDAAHKILMRAFLYEGGRRARAAGHGGGCHEGDPFMQMSYDLSEEEGGLQSSAAICVCPGNPAPSFG